MAGSGKPGKGKDAGEWAGRDAAAPMGERAGTGAAAPASDRAGGVSAAPSGERPAGCAGAVPSGKHAGTGAVPSGERAGTGATLVLAVDIGNTVTHIGLFDGDGMAASWSAATPPACTADEAGLVLAGFFGAAVRRGHLPALPAAAGAIVSSVVPALTDAWVGAAREACGGARPLVVGPGLKTGLKMAYHDPAEVGSDRIADIVAAKDSYGAPLVIVDLGTTTNIAVVDKEGAFAGGIIAPGMRMGGLALAQSAAKLAMTEVRAPASAIGKSTREAMQAGIVLGEAARIDGLVDMVCDELGYQAPVVMTGADAALVAPLLRHASRIDGGLTLRGLNLLYALNRRK